MINKPKVYTKQQLINSFRVENFKQNSRMNVISKETNINLL